MLNVTKTLRPLKGSNSIFYWETTGNEDRHYIYHVRQEKKVIPLCMYSRKIKDQYVFCHKDATNQDTYPPLCKYHLEGNCSLHPNTFLNISKNTWGDGTKQKPEKGDYKYEMQEICYKYDGNQWRKLCLICDKFARKEYCTLHNPQKILLSKNQQLCKRKSCEFIDMLQSHIKLKILHQHISDDHLSNIGTEVNIPDSQYRVDGLIEGTKIVIEFLGDMWHGNDAVYNLDHVHPKLNKTYGQLKKETFDRFLDIYEAGWLIFYVWEFDYNRFKSNQIPFESILHFYRAPSSLLIDSKESYNPSSQSIQLPIPLLQSIIEKK